MPIIYNKPGNSETNIHYRTIQRTLNPNRGLSSGKDSSPKRISYKILGDYQGRKIFPRNKLTTPNNQQAVL